MKERTVFPEFFRHPTGGKSRSCETLSLLPSPRILEEGNQDKSTLCADLRKMGDLKIGPNMLRKKSEVFCSSIANKYAGEVKKSFFIK